MIPYLEAHREPIYGKGANSDPEVIRGVVLSVELDVTHSADEIHRRCHRPILSQEDLAWKQVATDREIIISKVDLLPVEDGDSQPTERLIRYRRTSIHSLDKKVFRNVISETQAGG